MINPISVAQIAYKAYGESTGGKNYRGEQMPEWGDLGPQIQAAWMSAVTAVLNADTSDSVQSES